ncbi:hypothetical protein RDWZM_008707 [Blomia tropicalis]|uniref:N-acetyltransferase ESCO2 n=1 Tax=Blomia tropicalis TaxID=40697 RepID=A0A9Q0M552_BLOTA|nr:N-acetyltransferase esco2 [Blomia tropicalis]KAJ6217550.1 hypothetical protein RDWZM_008707 [Blomia tropicalis]
MDFLFQSPPKTPQELPSLKYHPIFDRRWQSTIKERESNSDSTSSSSSKCKPVRSKSNGNRTKPYSSSSRKKLFKWNDQYFLDCGQKNFDPIRCKTCNMVYTIGTVEDEKTHQDYHDTFINGIKYRQWKNEDIMAQYEDGRIIRVMPSSPHYMLKKMDELFKVADIELGVNVDLKSSITSTSQFFVFITKSSKRFAGFAFVERIATANWLISEEPLTSSTVDVPAECGVSRLWIQPAFRRKRIATRLLDTIRNHFIAGSVISKDKLAFSDPSPCGNEFAKAYMQSNRFLIYLNKLIE